MGPLPRCRATGAIEGDRAPIPSGVSPPRRLPRSGARLRGSSREGQFPVIEPDSKGMVRIPPRPRFLPQAEAATTVRLIKLRRVGGQGYCGIQGVGHGRESTIPALWGQARGRPRELRCREVGGVRLPRTERSRKDDHDQDADNASPTDIRGRERPGLRPQDGRPEDSRTDRSRPTTGQFRPRPERRNEPGHLRAHLERSPYGKENKNRGGHRAVRDGGVPEDADRRLVGRSATQVQVAREFIHDMDLLFLDEPTVGLDPIVRRALLDYLKERVRKGLTIFFTTHILEEAEYLCDRIAVINQGRIVQIDTPENLKRRFGSARAVEFKLLQGSSEALASALSSSADVTRLVQDSGTGAYRVTTTRPESVIPEIYRLAEQHAVTVSSIYIAETTLEDAFIHMVTDDENGRETARET